MAGEGHGKRLPRSFLANFQGTQEGKAVLSLTVCSTGEALLVSTEDIVGWWKKFFEDRLKSSDTSSIEKAESLDSSITGGEVTEAVKKLLGIWEEFLP